MNKNRCLDLAISCKLFLLPPPTNTRAHTQTIKTKLQTDFRNNLTTNILRFLIAKQLLQSVCLDVRRAAMDAQRLVAATEERKCFQNWLRERKNQKSAAYAVAQLHLYVCIYSSATTAINECC